MKSVSLPLLTAEWLFKPAALALALGMALAGIAAAQSKPTPAQQKELDAARVAVERAAERLAELTEKYGDIGSPIRIERRMLRKPVIGVVLAPDDQAGVRIAGITPDSAAESAGLKSGDRIVSIDGKTINAASASARVDQTRELLASVDAETPVLLAYSRDGKNQTARLTPKVADRLMFISGPDDDDDRDVRVFRLGDGQVEVIANRDRRDAGARKMDAHEMESVIQRAVVLNGENAQWSAAIAPGVHSEVLRLAGDCKGKDCNLPVLAEAFRWNGLNLASVDDGLGRYFGTTDGVLVLSTGKDLEGLQVGDVIQRIDGKAVGSPRQAMEALRAQPAAAKVKVEYMRDRKQGIAQVTVPKAFLFRVPPPPPVPPAPPAPPVAPAAPGAPHAVEKRKMVFVDDTGKVTQWEGDANDTPPAWVSRQMDEAGKGKQQRKFVIIDKDGQRREWEDDGSASMPPMPPGANRVEERTMVFVDEDGKRTVINGKDVPPPPPPPPAPPAPKAPPPPPAPPRGN